LSVIASNTKIYEAYIHSKVRIFSDETEQFIVKLAVSDKTLSLFVGICHILVKAVKIIVNLYRESYFWNSQ